ncbi:sugar transporter SWEET1 [Galendromus occidentalis]|uniref:Sugar transporter SWEET1 n=1 Tax=Galendromus occidentalis TaxID=34638 RepID=A0AAJ6QTU7_9ACAR|nr:sugar transporter SWEET1 [Galendromus occidentalis]
MDYTEIIANLATVATVINFASGVEICYKIYRQNSTVDCTPAPFMMGMLCSFLWFQYGIRKPDMTVTSVNVFGFTLWTAFLFWFYLYSKPKSHLNTHIGILLIVIFGTHFLLFYGLEDVDTALKVAGYMGVISSLAYFASPLLLLAKVLQTRCSQCLPLPLIVSSFCTASLWTLYGLLREDSFIVVPNGIASVITSSQLFLICIFPRKPQGDLTRLVI